MTPEPARRSIFPRTAAPMITDEFYTIQEPKESKIKIKGSSFIGNACPAESREQAEQFLAAIQKKYFDATHHCYAFITGFPQAPVFRYHDDGEPSGTAGKPIYQAITGRKLNNLIVVVTRYFGGTKLGTGGLARAYTDSAADVLHRCTIITRIIYKNVRVQFPYDDTSAVMRLISLFDAKINETRYDACTELAVAVRAGTSGEFCAQITEFTRGRAVILENK